MMTALECRFKADEMSHFAAHSDSAEDRAAFAGIAAGWRTTAALAKCQEQWEAANPRADSRRRLIALLSPDESGLGHEIG